MGNFMVILLFAMLVPYFVWGIYAMHLRFLRHHEWPVHIEVGTLAGLAVFYAMAFPMLRTSLEDTPAAMLFAMLGLFASGAALYGHMAISLTAKLVVDAVTHGGPAPNTPRLGPAEALERVRDYEGACAEYLVLARIYPHDVTVKMRMAENLCHMERHAEAADWFERALQKNPSRAVHSTIATRLADVAIRHLGDKGRARTALDGYLEIHADAPDRDVILARRESLDREVDTSVPVGLQSLSEEPLQDLSETEKPARAKTRKTKISLGGALSEEMPVAVESSPEVPVSSPGIALTPLSEGLDEMRDEEEAVPELTQNASLPGLAPLSDGFDIPLEKESHAPKGDGEQFSLERMEDSDGKK